LPQQLGFLLGERVQFGIISLAQQRFVRGDRLERPL